MRLFSRAGLYISYDLKSEDTVHCLKRYTTDSDEYNAIEYNSIYSNYICRIQRRTIQQQDIEFD